MIFGVGFRLAEGGGLRYGLRRLKPLTSHTCKLDEVQAKELLAWLRGGSYEFKEVPYANFSAVGDGLNVTYYQSGKLVLQGKKTSEFIEFVLEPMILKKAELGYEEVLKPELMDPRLGVDESGKGDFFGPLCVAGVYVNADVIHQWKEVGVRDSKQIGSDRKIAELARIIRETRGCVTTVVPIGNEAYNRLYLQFKNVNKLLAWGHARVIENLMLQKHRMNPPPIRAISDQFARSKAVIASALMGLGRQIELVQRHKAEEDLAVAAASILARDEFVSRLAKMGKEYGVVIPKGASQAVIDAGVELVRKHGEGVLTKVAKNHFKTTETVLAGAKAGN